MGLGSWPGHAHSGHQPLAGGQLHGQGFGVHHPVGVLVPVTPVTCSRCTPAILVSLLPQYGHEVKEVRLVPGAQRVFLQQELAVA